jgi:hypothetical protein
MLQGVAITGGYWTDRDFVIACSTGRFLHISAGEADVAWEVIAAAPTLVDHPIQQIGAPPEMLEWGPPVGLAQLDRSRLLKERINASIERLWVNEMGLWVFVRGFPALGFSAIVRNDTGEVFLFVVEDEG